MAFPLLALMLAAPVPVTPDTWTNEEEVYFAREAGGTPPPWIAVRDGRVVDAFGVPAASPPGFAAQADGDAMRVTFADGTVTTLRRGRPTTCWASVRRDVRKPDGTEDWTFQPRLAIHDQGGRARVGGDGAPHAIIRMRNVIWPGGGNRPSIVLYIHTPDQPDKAVSYAWADPGAARVGINLRWIQASCTIDGRDTPAASSRGDMK